jgi:hypothetical protein
VLKESILCKYQKPVTQMQTLTRTYMVVIKGL